MKVSTPRRAGFDWEWFPAAVAPLPVPTVPSAEPVDTGLLDQNGRKLYRSPEPIGFPIIGREQSK